MIARSWEFVFDDVRERAFEVKDRATFFHRLFDGVAALGFLFFGELELLSVRIRCVEVEGDGPDVLGVAGFLANVANAIFVDLVHGHIETNVV